MKNISFTRNSSDKILIRAANWVGDAIMTTPVIRAIRKNFPKAHITLLAKPWVVPVFAKSPYINEIMIYEQNGRHKIGLGTLRLIRDLRLKNFQIAFLMQNAFEAGLLAFMAGIDERVGYNTDGRTLLLNRSIRLNPALKKKHLIKYYNGILVGMGLKLDGCKMDIFLDQEDHNHAQNLLKELRLGKYNPNGPVPVLGINPGATGGIAKRWFPERYAELSVKLAKSYATKVLIFGGPADYKLGEEITRMTSGACINLAGLTSLGQAFALIDRLNLFITNDSGLMHAAAALNILQIAIIGSTDTNVTVPYSNRAFIVTQKVDCSPCCKKECPTDHKCMNLIHTDKVMTICQSILNSHWKKEENGRK